MDGWNWFKSVFAPLSQTEGSDETNAIWHDFRVRFFAPKNPKNKSTTENTFQVYVYCALHQNQNTKKAKSTRNEISFPILIDTYENIEANEQLQLNVREGGDVSLPHIVLNIFPL